MFLFQSTVFGSKSIPNQPLSDLKAQIFELYKSGNQANQTELGKLATTISKTVSDKSFIPNSEAASFCKAATDLLKQLKYNTKDLDVLLTSKNIPTNDIADKKAQNYINSVQYFKLSQRATDMLSETMDGLLQTGNKTEGALLTFGFKSKENLGKFIASLNSNPGHSFKIDFYESELGNLEVEGSKKQEMLAYINANKYSVLADYLSGKGTFNGEKYKFKDIREYCSLTDNVFANTQDRFGARKYVEVSNQFAVSFRLSQDTGKQAPQTAFIGSQTEDVGVGSKSYTSELVLPVKTVDPKKQLEIAIASNLLNKESASANGNLSMNSAHALSYGLQFTPIDPNSTYESKYMVDQQNMRPLANSLGYKFDETVADMRKTYGNKLAKYDDLTIFLASDKGQEFVKFCKDNGITLKITGTATMEVIFTGYNIEEFLREAEGNYKLALARAMKGTEYLDQVKKDLVKITTTITKAPNATNMVEYCPVGKVYFFQDDLSASIDMNLYNRKNYLKQFLKSNGIKGVNDMNGLLGRYGFNSGEAATNLNNFMHDLLAISTTDKTDRESKAYSKNSKDCYDKLLKGPIEYDKTADKYTIKKGAPSLKLLHDYFLTSDQGGMRTETPPNGFVKAETNQGGRGVEAYATATFDLGVKISGAKDNCATLKLKYGVNGETIEPDLGANLRAQVFFYNNDDQKLYGVPPEAVVPTGEKEAGGYYSYSIKLAGGNAFLYDGQTKVSIPKGKVLNGRFIAYSETMGKELTTETVWSTQIPPVVEPTVIEPIVPKEIPLPRVYKMDAPYLPAMVSVPTLNVNTAISSSTINKLGLNIGGQNYVNTILNATQMYNSGNVDGAKKIMSESIYNSNNPNDNNTLYGKVVANSGLLAQWQSAITGGDVHAVRGFFEKLAGFEYGAAGELTANGLLNGFLLTGSSSVDLANLSKNAEFIKSKTQSLELSVFSPTFRLGDNFVATTFANYYRERNQVLFQKVPVSLQEMQTGNFTAMGLHVPSGLFASLGGTYGRSQSSLFGKQVADDNIYGINTSVGIQTPLFGNILDNMVKFEAQHQWFKVADTKIQSYGVGTELFINKSGAFRPFVGARILANPQGIPVWSAKGGLTFATDILSIPLEVSGDLNFTNYRPPLYSLGVSVPFNFGGFGAKISTQ